MIPDMTSPSDTPAPVDAMLDLPGYIRWVSADELREMFPTPPEVSGDEDYRVD